MINQARLRMILRWVHIAAGIFLVGYVYKFHADAGATRVAQMVVVPMIFASGMWLWQQGRIVKWTRRNSSQTAAARS
ncbi:MAG TPA: hypothetical protein VMT53_09205 [Terriglobales bacterium]|nr:hypothetical protein [Terriglobales bacterium]